MAATAGPPIRSGTDEMQVLRSLLVNRTKRHRRGRFLVHGVRPIEQAASHGWPLDAVLHPEGRQLSRWAEELLATLPPTTRRRAVAPGLFAELADKDEPGELVAVARIVERGLEAADPTAGPVLVLDRPASPGNLGTVVRSADALGAAAVVVAGHAADPYDPRSVRASTGSLFAVPVLTAPGVGAALDFLAGHPAQPRLVAADESGTPAADSPELGGRVVLVLGTERSGLARAALERCDATVAVPQRGSASSLNVAVAASILLYEVDRRRRAGGAP